MTVWTLRVYTDRAVCEVCLNTGEVMNQVVLTIGAVNVVVIVVLYFIVTRG